MNLYADTNNLKSDEYSDITEHCISTLILLIRPLIQQLQQQSTFVQLLKHFSRLPTSTVFEIKY